VKLVLVLLLIKVRGLVFNDNQLVVVSFPNSMYK